MIQKSKNIIMMAHFDQCFLKILKITGIWNEKNQYLTFSFVWLFCSDIFYSDIFIIIVVKIFLDLFWHLWKMFHHFGWFDLGEKSINVTWLSLNALSAPSLPPLVQIFGGVSSSSTAIITKNAFFPLQPTKI